MPRYHNVFAGLAVLALASAPGAEAIVCGGNQYLEMDGGYVSGSAANAPQCTACPTGMTNVAGSAGGYGDSADPDIAHLVAKYAAQSSVNTNLLSWCSVPADSYLTTAATSTSPGAITACGTATGTFTALTTAGAVATTITGPTAVQTSAQCFTKSKCAADQYLDSDSTLLTTGAQLTCKACPSTMTAAAGPELASADVTRAHTAVTGTTAAPGIFTWCSVPEDAYLTTAASNTSPGDMTLCGTAAGTFTALTTAGAIATTITGPTAVQTSAQCFTKSKCLAAQYLDSDSTILTTGAQLTCKACPSTMTAAATPELASADVTRAHTAVTGTTAAPGIFTWCSVPEDAYLTTAASN